MSRFDPFFRPLFSALQHSRDQGAPWRNKVDFAFKEPDQTHTIPISLLLVGATCAVLADLAAELVHPEIPPHPIFHLLPQDFLTIFICQKSRGHPSFSGK